MQSPLARWSPATPDSRRVSDFSSPIPRNEPSSEGLWSPVFPTKSLVAPTRQIRNVPGDNGESTSILGVLQSVLNSETVRQTPKLPGISESLYKHTEFIPISSAEGKPERSSDSKEGCNGFIDQTLSTRSFHYCGEKNTPKRAGHGRNSEQTRLKNLAYEAGRNIIWTTARHPS